MLAAAGAELLVAESGDPDEVVALAPGCDAILTCWKQVPPAALDAAPGCLVVGRYGVGLDNIPVERATELGIVVTNVPDFCVDEVAEHTLALILALNRQLVAFSRQTRAGEWDNSAAGPLHRLAGQTLGLLGCGRTGAAIAARARALGLRVLAFTRSERELPEGVERVAKLDELLAAADFVSIHVPLTAATTGMIGEPELRRMRPSASLVNTARGGVVDQAALVRALREGWIAGAGLDVLAAEPPDPNDALLQLDNVVVTPHAAFYSEEAIADLQQRAAANVAGVLRGEVPDNVVNPEVLVRPDLRMKRAGR